MTCIRIFINVFILCKITHFFVKSFRWQLKVTTKKKTNERRISIEDYCFYLKIQNKNIHFSIHLYRHIGHQRNYAVLRKLPSKWLVIIRLMISNFSVLIKYSNAKNIIIITPLWRIKFNQIRCYWHWIKSRIWIHLKNLNRYLHEHKMFRDNKFRINPRSFDTILALWFILCFSTTRNHPAA